MHPQNGAPLVHTAASISLSPSVRTALSHGSAIVALESTIIAHGLPYPSNIACARALEAAVRAVGAVPATIAVIDGFMQVGLSAAQLRRISDTSNPVLKLGVRDIGRAIALRLTGATTVSATTHIASLLGISVFATGGIGGVHRGPLDVSQDILTLATRPVLVVSAGVKSVLNVRATLELLEAAAVPVLVWNAAQFPLFYTRESKFPAPAVVRGAREAAQIFRMGIANGTGGGMLLAVPVPEEQAAQAGKVESAVTQALEECKNRKVSGKEVTPFLLRRVAEISGGESLRANVALAVHNATVAAQVAVQLSMLDRKEGSEKEEGNRSVDVVVAGVAAIDIIAKPCKVLVNGSSSPGRIIRSLGGVACNVARAVADAGVNVSIVAAVGHDEDGKSVREMLRTCGVNADSVFSVTGHRTPIYCAVHDESGDLKAAVADMDAAGNDGEELISRVRGMLMSEGGAKPKVLAVDGNLNSKTLRALCENAKNLRALTWYEPTSVPKAARIVHGGALRFVDFMSPNQLEVQALGDACGGGKDEEDCARKLIDAGVGAVVVTRGKIGAALYLAGRNMFEVRAEEITVENTSGAGDALAGTMIAHIAQFGRTENSLRDAMRAGMRAAASMCARVENTERRSRL